MQLSLKVKLLLFFCPSLLCAFRGLTVWNFPINELIPLNWEPEPFLFKFSCSRPCESSCSANFIRIYSRDNFVELAKFGAFFFYVCLYLCSCKLLLYFQKAFMWKIRSKIPMSLFMQRGISRAIYVKKVVLLFSHEVARAATETSVL